MAGISVGMLWFDNDPKTSLTDKIRQAADYYRAKYGPTPTLCFVNPAMLKEPQTQVGEILVKPLRSILPGHLWLGQSETPPKE